MVDSSEKAFLKQLPDFRTYEDAPLTELPFVTESSTWSVPQELGFMDATQVGREYAAHFSQYLKDNPSTVDSSALAALASGTKGGPAGFRIGFFTYLQRLIRAQAQTFDLFENLAREHEAYLQLRNELN